MEAVNTFVAGLGERLDVLGQTPEGERAVLVKVVDRVVYGAAGGAEVFLSVPIPGGRGDGTIPITGVSRMVSRAARTPPRRLNAAAGEGPGRTVAS